jgi:hypothetical protein
VAGVDEDKVDLAGEGGGFGGEAIEGFAVERGRS